LSSYAAALKAYADVGRRIIAALKNKQAEALLAARPAAVGPTGDADSPRGVTAFVALVPAADVQVDHHLLAAAIQTQVIL
jgi:hypothetical protein